MLLILALACYEVVTGLAPPCLPDAPVPDVTQAAPGDTVRLTSHPLGDDYDTAVYVGSMPAELLGVSRVGCDDYDSCLDTEGCSACGDCDACGGLLLACVETARIRVPAIADGTYGVVIYTQYGETQPATLTVAGPDTGGTDTSAP